MKNVIISGLIVAILAAGVCAFSIGAVEETCARMDEMSTRLRQLHAAGERERAQACAVRMLEYWQSRSGVLECILNHETVEAVGEVLGRLGADEQTAFEEDVLLLERMLRRIERNERLLMSNILNASGQGG